MDAFPQRALVDLGADGAADDRTVRGEVIAALLLGAAAAEPGRVPGIRLAGARITGVIDVSDGDVGAAVKDAGGALRAGAAIVCR